MSSHSEEVSGTRPGKLGKAQAEHGLHKWFTRGNGPHHSKDDGNALKSRANEPKEAVELKVKKFDEEDIIPAVLALMSRLPSESKAVLLREIANLPHSPDGPKFRKWQTVSLKPNLEETKSKPGDPKTWVVLSCEQHSHAFYYRLQDQVSWSRGQREMAGGCTCTCTCGRRAVPTFKDVVFEFDLEGICICEGLVILGL